MQSQAQSPPKPYSLGRVPEGARRLHLNEYRYDHPPEVVAAAAAVTAATAAASPLRTLSEYPADPDPALVEDLARFVDAPRECVAVTPGSDEALRAVIDTAGAAGIKSVLIGTPSYTHFEHYARARGLAIVTYALGFVDSPSPNGREHALRYYADLLAAGCLVYLCSPNNPTGDIWGAAFVAALAAEFPRSLFLVDEAYIEFADAAALASAAPDAAALNARSLVPVAVATPNVIVTRTLSKAFGLAALRLGYAVGSPAHAAAVAAATSPKAFAAGGSAIARAALRNAGHYRAAALAARVEGVKTVTALELADWWARTTPANFFLVHVGAGQSAAAVAALAAAGVVVRDRGDLPGLTGFVRVTAGTPEDSAAVLKAFASLRPAGWRPSRANPQPPIPQCFYTDKMHVALCKTLLKRTVRILGDLGVEYFATAGTLLGMVRHGGMVPTDDDCDLGYCRSKDGSDPLEHCGGLFAAEGLALQRNRTGAYWQVGTNSPSTLISDVHVDIFSYSLRGEPARYVVDDERFRDEDPASSQAHCNTSYAVDELYPLRRDLRFYDLVIPVPARCEDVLRRALGDDYMSVMRVRLSRAPPAEVRLGDYSPA